MISVTVRGITAELLGDFPGPTSQFSQPPTVSALFSNETFHHLADTEAWLDAHPELSYSFTASPGKTLPASTVNARSTVGIRVRPFKHGEWSESVQESLGRCPKCHFVRDRVLPVGSDAWLLFERPPSADLICIGGRLTICASEAFVEAVKSAGLARGLVAHAVESAGDERQWFVLRSSTTLALPPQPFGAWKPDCSVCQRRFDRYRIVPVFQPVDTESHWMMMPEWAARPMVVSGPLYEWLVGPGARFLAPIDAEKQLDMKVYGRYPEHAGYAYVPQQFHAPDTEVLDASVLRHMVFDAIPVDTRPPVDTAAFDDRVERGIFQSVYRALNWDHDIVYTLDLSDRPVTRLYGEDLAKFRNLNQLLVANTRIEVIPDEVAGLPNLRRIDLTGTPNAAAELRRLSTLLAGRNITLVG